jgi:hypothetical protein
MAAIIGPTNHGRTTGRSTFRLIAAGVIGKAGAKVDDRLRIASVASTSIPGPQ